MTSIGGDLSIIGNGSLTSLTGLENLIHINGGLEIGNTEWFGGYCLGNPLLTSLEGLDNLTTIGGDFEITCNDSLINLSGLESLASIGGSLNIGKIVYTQGGGYYAVGNPSLTSLTGLDNLTSIGTDIFIASNNMLSSCEVQSLCEYLASPNGVVSVFNNGPGCNSPAEIANACGNTIPCLPYGDYYFYTQDDIDNFQDDYPGCTELQGNGIIGVWNGGPTNISDLSGLSVITSIEGNLEIGTTYSLVDLTGLDNLNLIEGNFTISSNSSLTSLEGLESLNSIGGDLNVMYNAALTSLTGLDSLSSIGGGLWIDQNDLLTSLTGLNSLSSIGEDIFISDNNTLASLTGLENVTSIGGDLYVIYNVALTSLSGPDNLTSIGGKMLISSNDALTSLTGLQNLTSIGGDLDIYDNEDLIDLTGLNGLVSVGAALYICRNYSLLNLTGLENLTYCDKIYIGGSLGFGNQSLMNLEGISNIDAGSLNYLLIRFNNSLSDCDAQSICHYLASPNASVYIFGNATGCNSQDQVIEDCGNNCLPSGITFSSQAEIDNFLTNYPNCSDIEGDVEINGDDITDLSGLSAITSLKGNLSIHDNPGLSNLSGLNNVTFIWGNLWIIGNDILPSLSGLQNISSINGDLWIENNNSLSGLSGLDNLATVIGGIYIYHNDSLTSLSGIEKINPATIDELSISNNNSLSVCDVKSICDYLASPNANVEIHDNDSGCNSPEELEEACNSHCLFEGITFSTQEQIDDFQANYPGCNQIEGYVRISGEDISNVTGLNLLISINESLVIGTNFYPYIGNPLLSSLSGLENIAYVGGDLILKGNAALNNITGLFGLTAIGEDLTIESNNSLKSLNGLDNINAGSIEDITIRINDSLSTCNVQSICDYLASPNGNINIQNNAPGCNSPFDVEWACVLGVMDQELGTEESFILSPNPLQSTVSITYTVQQPTSVSLKILDLSSRERATLINGIRSPGQHTLIYDASGLPAGVYFCVLKSREGVQTKKMIKLNH